MEVTFISNKLNEHILLQIYFFSIYTHVKPAGELRQGCDYALFKKGIRPMWEDKHNKKGGRWLISLEKKQRVQELDKYWIEIVRNIFLNFFEP